MIKRLVLFIILLALLLGLEILLVLNLVNTNVIEGVPLFTVSIFAYVAGLVVYLVLEIMLKHMPNSVGYTFLVLLFIKLGLFLIVFKEWIQDLDGTPIFQRLFVLIPIVITLLLETVFLGRVLSKEISVDK